MPAFYRREPGAVLSTSIEKYVYIALHPYFEEDKIQLKYSMTERVGDIEHIQHPIFREVLRMYNIKGVDINSIADIPAGTGLGASSAFTVGLLNAVGTYCGKPASKERLAQLACDIEMVQLKEHIGKQDQYATALGGLNFITFYGDESVNVEKIIMQPTVKQQLQDNLILAYVGGTHKAQDILKAQQEGMQEAQKFEAQRQMVQLAYQLRGSLESGQINEFGRFLHEGWLLKKSLSKDISNQQVDEIYQSGLNAGALGGKLLGAGGAGFILFYCPQEKQAEFRKKLPGIRLFPFKFDNSGTKIIFIGENFD